MNKDKYYKAGYQKLLDECEKLDSTLRIEELNALKKRADEFGKMKILRYGNNVRLTSCDIAKLAYFYKQTGKKEFLTKLIDLMLYVANVDKWLFQGKVDEFFNADLWTGDICTTLSYGFDCIKDELDDSQRETIKNAIITKGIEPIYNEWINPESHKHALDTMGHNWWCVIVCGALTGVVVLGDSFKKYDEYYGIMIEGLKQWFNYNGNILQNKKGNFGKEGDFIEFVGYLSYALSNYTIVEELIRIKRGKPEIFEEEKLNGLIDYYMLFLQTLDNEVRIANFGDTPFSNTTNAHLYFYLASRFDRPDLLKLFKQTYKQINNVFDLYFYPETDIDNAEIKAPLSGIFNHSGYAVMRSGYTAKDWFFAIKSGESWNHNHRDIGTFIISAKGKEFIVDSGTCTYSKPQYQGYYTKPEAHNTVIFDGAGQHPDSIYCGTKYMGNFPSNFEAEDFKYLLCDGTGPLTNIYQRYYRHIMTFENVILMIDDLHAYREGKFSYLLHYKGNTTEKGDNLIIENSGEKLIFCSLFPKNTTRTYENGYYAEIKNNINDDGILPESRYLRIDCDTDSKHRQKLINAFVLPYGKAPEFTTHQSEDMLCTEIEFADSIYKIYCNTNADGRIMHFNGLCNYKEIYTDAFITIIKTDKNGKIEKAGMINGSFLKIKGDTKFSSLLKFDCITDFKNNNITANTSVKTIIYVKTDKIQGFSVEPGKSIIKF